MRTVFRLIAVLLALSVAVGSAPAQQRAEPRQAPTNPTQALFDAINLGDLDEVRAAVAAGANLGARNVLGLTPLDLALDLGQMEIAFFLMSLGRAPTRAQPSEPAAPRAPAPIPPVAGRGQARSVPLPALPAPAAAVPAAPLWRGDGGAPVPEAGFLGFDAGRPAGARPPAADRPRG
ncbi:MAG: ankyrin repeat domain-containing protein [Acetobacteraceae bacterium]|nr:ankyrin repeat domain-containing protein [Acetobacteraceae bacterium]